MGKSLKEPKEIISKQLQYYRDNKKKILESKKKFRDENKELMKERKQEFYKCNKERILIQRRKYYEENCEKIKKYKREYNSNNLPKVNANSAKKYSRKKLAIPKWLTKDQLLQIQEFYIESKRLEKLTGLKYHVDHIIPIKGETVCGLHVPWNLQILTAEENMRKRNKL